MAYYGRKQRMEINKRPTEEKSDNRRNIEPYCTKKTLKE